MNKLNPEAQAEAPAPLDVDAIQERVAAATNGPWKAKATASGRCDGIVPDYHNHEGDDCYADDERGPCPSTEEIVTTDAGYYGPKWADAEFIAHAREDIPALLAEVTRLRAQLEKGVK